jgi:hypothetical protein
MLKIEQPAALNKYVDPNIPLTWSKRWNGLKRALPFLVLTMVFMVESVLLRWLLNKPVNFNALIMGLPLLPLFILVVAEIQLRVGQRTKRFLIVDRTGVLLSADGKKLKYKWPWIEAFEIFPIHGEPSLHKLVVWVRPGNERNARPSSGIVIPTREAERQLRTCLDSRAQFEGAEYEVRAGSEKDQLKQRHRMAAIIWFSFAMFLLFNGIPMAMVGLGATSAHHEVSTVNPSPHQDRLSVLLETKMGPWLRRNFKSSQETQNAVRRTFLLAGVVLTAAGAGAWLMAKRTLKRDTLISRH